MGSRFDWIIKGGNVVLPHEVSRLDIGVKDGTITELAYDIPPDGSKVLDAAGQFILPGMIDVHVHLNEPGLGDWEGFRTGSSALAAGGCTTFVDMPLNGIPPTVTAAALELKLEAARSSSYIDYAIWGGLVPGKLVHLQELAEQGVIGYKAFMSSPGDPSEDAFREVDDLTLYEGMKRIAKLGRVLALHAESEPIVAKLAAQALAEGRNTAADFVATRPILAEVEAVNRALFYAEQTGCALHFVHISSAEAVERITAAKRKGMDVTVETCPHYLVMTDRDLASLGAVAKCAPPLRSQEEQDRLWKVLLAGEIDMVSSDHSPCPGEMKVADDVFSAWGGISGAQSSLELIVDEGYLKRGMKLTEIARILSSGPAKRFGLYPRKGEIALGFDADIVLIDTKKGYVLERDQLLYKHKHSPYVGRSFGCKVTTTMCAGQIVYEQASGVKGEPRGRYIKYAK